ncbi:unnamed protein product, partial [Darwinula stevensoni]
MEVKQRSVNSTAAIVEWKLPKPNENLGFIVGYQIYIQEERVGDAPPEMSYSYSVTDGSALTYIVTDLQPDSTYKVQVAALTRAGEGARSSANIVKTSGEVPSRPSLQMRLATEESPKAVIKATWSNPNQTFGKILGWRLRYEKWSNYCATLLDNDVEKLDMEEIILDGLDQNEYTIQDLEKGFRYEFRLAARNDIGYGQEGFANITTPEGPPTGPPANISFHFLTLNIVVVTWDVPEASYCNGRIINYNFQLRKSLEDSLIFERNISTPKLLLKDLEVNTTHYFRISAYTIAGAGPFSEKMNLTTLPDIIRGPSNVRAMAITNNSLHVWWEEVLQVNVSGYRIYYTMNETMDLDLWMQKDAPRTWSAELENLKHSVNYSIRVAARTKEGDLGKLSKMIQVKVKLEYVPTITRVKIEYRSEFIWESPPAFKPQHYQVSIDAVKEFVDSNGFTKRELLPATCDTFERTEATFHSLKSFTTYRLNVTAISLDATYRPPASIYFTTDETVPPEMEAPRLYGVTNSSTIMVVLPRASEIYGPITWYLLVVLPESQKTNYSKPSEDYSFSNDVIGRNIMVKFSDRYRHLSSPSVDPLPEDQPYIAAKFLGQDIPYIFNLGDGETYYGYLNKQLRWGKRYRIFVRAHVDKITKV